MQMSWQVETHYDIAKLNSDFVWANQNSNTTTQLFYGSNWCGSAVCAPIWSCKYNLFTFKKLDSATSVSIWFSNLRLTSAKIKLLYIQTHSNFGFVQDSAKEYYQKKKKFEISNSSLSRIEPNMVTATK